MKEWIARTERSVEKIFVEPEDGPWTEVLAEGKRTPALAREVERLVLAERVLMEQLGVDTDAVGPLQAQRLRRQIFAQLDREAAAPRRRFLWVASAAMASALGVMALVLLRPATVPEGNSPAWQARGTQEPAAELYCVRNVSQPQFEPMSQTGHCPIGGYVQIAIRNPESRFHYLTVLGESADGSEVLPYLPSPSHPESVSIGVEPRLVPVGTALEFAVNHKPGTYTWTAIFSEQPLEGFLKPKQYQQQAQSRGFALRLQRAQFRLEP